MSEENSNQEIEDKSKKPNGVTLGLVFGMVGGMLFGPLFFGDGVVGAGMCFGGALGIAIGSAYDRKHKA